MPNYQDLRKKEIGIAFRYPDGKQIKLDQDNSRIFLPKIGYVNYHNSRRFNGEINSITVSKEPSGWFVSINFDEEYEPKETNSDTVVGIDMGIAKFAALSNGVDIKPLNIFRKYEAKTVKLSKQLSRKVKFSNNWKKQKAKLSKHHSKIANVRKDFLHKTTTKIANNYQTVIMENLKVSNMSSSAKGTIEQPGKNIKAKSGLNKSILDQGWYEFKRQLEYKLNWRNGKLIQIDPKYTSQTCSVCGHIHKDNRKSQAIFECLACGHKDNADTNAAKNILAAGLCRVSLPSESLKRSATRTRQKSVA